MLIRNGSINISLLTERGNHDFDTDSEEEKGPGP